MRRTNADPTAQEAGTSDSAFEDEESHAFYEVLPQLQGLVPSVLLQGSASAEPETPPSAASTPGEALPAPAAPVGLYCRQKLQHEAAHHMSPSVTPGSLKEVCKGLHSCVLRDVQVHSHLACNLHRPCVHGDPGQGQFMDARLAQYVCEVAADLGGSQKQGYAFR